MWLTLSGLCAAVLSLAGIFLYLDPQVPRAESYRNVQLAIPLRVYADDGSLLAEFGERRLIPVTLDDVPDQFINALLDTEDKRFYEHSGIDFISLTNDVFNLIGTLVTEGELGPGASTITMQLARNVSFSLERRFLRKFKEMLLALKIERELTKDEILELYINIVPYGKRAYGAQAAALTYYGKTLDHLNLPQLAMLAGIPQAPSAGNPINGPERAVVRRNQVLSRMHDQGSISDTQYKEAVATPISARVYGREIDAASPYAAEWVRQQAATLLPDLYTGGYEIFTTINSRWQTEAIQALRKGLQQYDRDHGYRGPEAHLTQAQIDELSLHADTLAAFLDAHLATQERVKDQVLEDQVKEQDSEREQSPAHDNIGADQPLAIPTHTPVPLPAALSDEIHDFLAEFDPYGGLQPGVVLFSNASHAVVQTHEREFTVIAFDDAQWARPYVDVDMREPLPERFDQLLVGGDVIRLRDVEGRNQLAQLPEVQGALVSLEPETGRVRSLVGGFDFYHNQFNHALQAARQPGSGFKPLVYSAALNAGVTASDIFLDAPLVFDDDNLETQYRPDNDNNRYNGPTRLREALYRSINLVSIRVMLKIGAEQIIEHAARFGLYTNSFPRNTQLAIGGGTIAITPMDMARAYAVFANGGYLIDPYIIDYIKDSEGETIYQSNHPVVCRVCEEEEEEEGDAAEEGDVEGEEADKEDRDAEDALLVADAGNGSEAHADSELDESPAEQLNGVDEEQSLLEPLEPPPAERVLDERNAFIMHSMLKDVILRGTGVRAKSMNRGDIAGKTGTTNEAADTWFNGFTPDLATTVWVGFSNHKPLGARAYGSNTPLPIWIDFMNVALADAQERYLPQPANLLSTKIDPETGEQAAPGQSNALFEYFLSEHPPKESTRSNTQDVQLDNEDEIKAVDLF